MSLHVLGIDPGMASVGVAVMELLPDGLRLVEAGVIRTQKADKKRRVRAADDNIERTREIASELLRSIRTYRPVAICAESMSFPRSSSVAGKMAMCWGALAAIAEERHLPVLQATPQEIKQVLTGSKAAGKEEVQAAVLARLAPRSCRDIESIPRSQQEHAYDAMAAVMACEGSEVIRMARQMMEVG